jgi:hypothetical protein
MNFKKKLLLIAFLIVNNFNIFLPIDINFKNFIDKITTFKHEALQNFGISIMKVFPEKDIFINTKEYIGINAFSDENIQIDDFLNALKEDRLFLEKNCTPAQVADYYKRIRDFYLQNFLNYVESSFIEINRIEKESGKIHQDVLNQFEETVKRNCAEIKKQLENKTVFELISEIEKSIESSKKLSSSGVGNWYNQKIENLRKQSYSYKKIQF